MLSHKPSKKLIVLIIAGYFLTGLLLSQMVGNPQQILATTVALYETQGYLIIFAVAFLESLFLIGFFIPGTLAILFGATLAAKGVLFLPLVIAAGAGGYISGSVTNYFLGKYIWKKFAGTVPETVAALFRQNNKYVSLLFFSTGVSAFLTTAAGILQFSFGNLLQVIVLSHIAWVCFWACLAFFLGVTISNTILGFALLFVIGLFVSRVVKKKVPLN